MLKRVEAAILACFKAAVLSRGLSNGLDEN